MNWNVLSKHGDCQSMSEQVKIEQEMLDKGYASRQRKIQRCIEKGRESETDYARSMIAAGLEPFSKSIQQFIDRSWRGKPGPKAIAALKITLEEMASDGYISMIQFPKRLKETKGRTHYFTQCMEEDLLNTFLHWGLYEHHDFVKCLMDTGARLSELFGLEKRYVDFNLNQITFPDRKCDNPVSVPMTDEVQKILRPYYLKARATDKLFPYSSYWLRTIWNRVRDHLGYSDKDWYVPHLCRHTCATRLVQRGVPLGVVKDWMGHECIQATMIYAHHAPKQLHEAVKVLNSKESSTSIAS